MIWCCSFGRLFAGFSFREYFVSEKIYLEDTIPTKQFTFCVEHVLALSNIQFYPHVSYQFLDLF